MTKIHNPSQDDKDETQTEDKKDTQELELPNQTDPTTVNDEDSFEKLSKIVGHIELQTICDFKQEFSEQSM